MFKYRR